MAKTDFHRKLDKYFSANNRSGHWLPHSGAPTAVRLPGDLGITSLRRAIYAAYTGDLPGGMRLKSSCGVRACLRPVHQVLSPFSGKASPKPLSLGKILDDKCSHRFVPPEPVGRLPRGLPLAVFEKVRRMRGSYSLSSARTQCDLPNAEIMKIWAGRYDHAANIERRRLSSMSRAADKKASTSGPDSTAEKALIPSSATDEEVAWLRTVS